MSSDGWTCDAPSAVQLSLVQCASKNEQPKLESTANFQPEFTHSVFGEEETIFGYKGLIIRLRFAAHDLRPNLHISYDERFQQVKDTKAVDLNETLRPFLPKEAFKSLQDYQKSILDADPKSFTPPGKLVNTYTSRGRNYEIWAGSLFDKEVRKLFDRIQILVPFFIDGGQTIDTQDFEWTLRRWTVYFVYEKTNVTQEHVSPYSFVGLSTTYRWWFYRRPTGKPTPTIDEAIHSKATINGEELPSRLRIAQLLILPPHQSAGHGSHLYRTIRDQCLSDPNVYELTVEDPNEDFDNLRDINDFRLIKPEFEKRGITININPYADLDPSAKRPPRRMPTSKLLSTTACTDLRTTLKLARNQFSHLLELYLLSQIPATHRGPRANMARLVMQKWRAKDENDRRYYWWRMLVKQRLYKKNKDVLMQAEAEERLDALDTTLGSVEEGYEEVLEALGAREAQLAREGEGIQRTGKRKVVSDSGDEDATEEEAKKRRSH